MRFFFVRTMWIVWYLAVVSNSWAGPDVLDLTKEGDRKALETAIAATLKASAPIIIFEKLGKTEPTPDPKDDSFSLTDLRYLESFRSPVSINRADSILTLKDAQITSQIREDPLDTKVGELVLQNEELGAAVEKLSKLTGVPVSLIAFGKTPVFHVTGRFRDLTVRQVLTAWARQSKQNYIRVIYAFFDQKNPSQRFIFIDVRMFYSQL